MGRFAILVILLYNFSLAYPMVQGKERYDREQIRVQSIQKLIEAEESLDVVRMHYQELVQVADSTHDERMRAECLFQVARIYYWQAEFATSLAETKRGLVIARQLNDKELLAVGYDLLGRLHYLFSPEQAQYYYQKCWKYCEQSDSIDIAVANMNSYNIIRNEREVSLDDLLSIDFKPLSPLSRARLSYLIARSMLAEKRIGEALKYLECTREFLDKRKGTSLLNTMYEQRLAQIAMMQGDTRLAWMHLDKSLEIARKNKMLMGIVDNYKLASEIAQSEGKEDVALDFFKKSAVLRDSIFYSVPNRYFPDDLIYTMMENVAGDEAQARKKTYLLIGAFCTLVLIAGIGLFYYFKTTHYRKKTATVLTDIGNHNRNGLHPRMKNHVMKIMYDYKSGVYHCMKYMMNVQRQPSDVPEIIHYCNTLEENMYQADEFLNALFDWLKSPTGMHIQKTDFDAKEVIEQIIALHKIGSVSKNITFHLSIDKPIIIRGDKNMFSIAMEHLFFRIIKAADRGGAVMVSATNGEQGHITFSVSDPGNKKHTVENKIFAQRVGVLETTKTMNPTADWDFNVFADCSISNCAKIRIESHPESGTIYFYNIPAESFD